MWNMFLFAALSNAQMGPLDVDAVVLRYPRDPQGISVAIQELQPVFQTCIDHIPVEGNPGTLLTRMHFSIAPEGYVQGLQVILAAANPALQDCLANPLKELRFSSGAQSQPVEVPFRLKIVGNTNNRTAESSSKSVNKKGDSDKNGESSKKKDSGKKGSKSEDLD